MNKSAGWSGIVNHYRPLLNIDNRATPISLHEGNTPLIPVPRLTDHLDMSVELYVKYEGLNPTGSFKDRGMTAAITQAVSEDAKAVICASTGNTAASAAAYAARAGLRCIVVVPQGKIALGKLAGALAYGADVVEITGNFDEGLELVKQAAEELPVTLVNSINPYRLQGQKTAAFEIVDALGDAPDWLCLPVGNAGNITAYWMGFTEYVAHGLADSSPRLLGAQASGAAPIVNDKIVENPETVATAIRIGNPARWEEAKTALSDSNGKIVSVTDHEILTAWRLLSEHEGIFVEPASAAGLAGLIQCINSNAIDARGKQIVCVVTGHGLKDPDAVLNLTNPTITRLSPEFSAFADYFNSEAKD